MRVTDLLSRLWRPLAWGSALLILVTFLMRHPSIEAWATDGPLGQFDLWTEGSLAALFSSAVFGIAAISFAPMAWPSATTRRLPAVDLLVLRAAALGLAFFAVDEMLELHEALGAWLGSKDLVKGSTFEGGVFSWVLVYGPVVILGSAALRVVMGRAVDTAPEGGAARAVRPLLAWIVLGPATLLVCEVVEAHLWAGGARMTVLGAIEESLELVTLLVLIHLNVAIARDHRA